MKLITKITGRRRDPYTRKAVRAAGRKDRSWRRATRSLRDDRRRHW